MTHVCLNSIPAVA